MAEVENIGDHMAMACDCGCVSFNLLKSGRLECCQCGIKQRYLKWGYDMDTNKDIQPAPEKPEAPDYTSPIARTGEQQFACILRNRSGQDAGDIDFGARFINHLGESDQQAAVDCVFAVYEKWCKETAKKATRDV